MSITYELINLKVNITFNQQQQQFTSCLVDVMEKKRNLDKGKRYLYKNECRNIFLSPYRGSFFIDHTR